MSSRQYFLGIGGDQSGPYLEEDILNRIRQGEVPPDSLVWFEGLPDWQPIQSVEFLKEVFSEAGADFTASQVDIPAPAPSPKNSGNFTPLRNDATENYSSNTKPIDPGSSDLDASTFTSGSAMKTVFSAEEATFGKGSGRSKGRMMGMMIVLALCGAAGGVFMVIDSGISIPGFSSEEPAKELQVERLPAQDDRQTKLRKAMSELLIHPETSIPILQEVVKGSGTDAPGKEAVDALLEYYKNQRNPSEAGRLLLSLGRPLEASQMFLSDPPSYAEAEAAIFAAYKTSNDANKKDLLIQDIRLLLGQANNPELAVERIRLLEKEFKGTKHPFGYYLSSVDTRIADIFNRTSFHFVQKLLTFIETEFPQMSLARRPVVEIQKDKRGRYRVVGKYDGPISLQQDKMDNMTILFWFVGESWIVVDTNITPERAKWASEERNRTKDATLSSSEMLTFMENVFRVQFPKAAIHETVSLPNSTNKNVQ